MAVPGGPLGAGGKSPHRRLFQAAEAFGSTARPLRKLRLEEWTWQAGVAASAEDIGRLEEETAFQFQGTRRPGIRDVARNQGRFACEPEPDDGQKRMAAPCGFRFCKGHWVEGVKSGYPAAARSRG